MSCRGVFKRLGRCNSERAASFLAISILIIIKYELYDTISTNSVDDLYLSASDSAAVVKEYIYNPAEASVFVSGSGLSWKRTYFRANASPCQHIQQRPEHLVTALPIFDNGHSAGPIIHCNYTASNQTNTSLSVQIPDSECSKAYYELSAIRALIDGSAFRVPVVYQPPRLKISIVLDRVRMSSATGIVFLSPDHFATASFGMQMVYLYRYDMARQTARLVDSVVNSEFSNGTGSRLFVDVLGYDGDGLLITSNLKSATQTVIAVDVANEKLTHVKHVRAFADEPEQWNHGARFFISPTCSDDGLECSNDIVLVTSSKARRPTSLMMRFFDWKQDKILGSFYFNDSRHGGFKAQDVVFIDEHNLLAPLTTNVVQAHSRDCSTLDSNRHFAESHFVTRLVHYRIDFDPREIAAGMRGVANKSEWHEIQSIEIADAHPDTIDYKRGVAVLSDQFNDRVTFIKVDVTGKQPMRHIANDTGYLMPHGVAFSKTEDVMGVSCYGDNSVIIQNIPHHIVSEFDA